MSNCGIPITLIDILEEIVDRVDYCTDLNVYRAVVLAEKVGL